MRRGEFTPATRRLVRDRDARRCVLCGLWVGEGGQIHHRRARGMGGSRDSLTVSPANARLLCMECHVYVESHRRWALESGFLVRQGVDPGSVLVRVDARVVWRLGHDGSRVQARRDEMERWGA